MDSAGSLLKELIKQGWTPSAIAKRTGVQKRTVSSWLSGAQAPRPTALRLLRELHSKPPVQSEQNVKRARRRTKRASKNELRIGDRLISTASERETFFRQLLRALDLSRPELAEHLGLGTRTVDNLLDPNYPNFVLGLVDPAKLEDLITHPPPS
ncbi:MAG: helix-turn-helix domain-containing protein, partial [Blastocatellia bacterium]